jgi:hypothetical protein
MISALLRDAEATPAFATLREMMEVCSAVAVRLEIAVWRLLESDI